MSTRSVAPDKGVNPPPPNHFQPPNTSVPQEVPPPEHIPPVPLTVPPDTGVYETREELYVFLQAFANSHGYVVTHKNSKKNKWVTYRCDRGGKYFNRRNLQNHMRKCKGGTRLIGCPFLVLAKLTDVGWKLKVVDGKHNHGPTPDLLGYPQVRLPR